MIKKKIYIVVFIALTITTVVLYVFLNVNAKRQLATDFLTALYTSDAERWQRAEGIATLTGDMSTAMEEYFALYAPITTRNGYEALIANRTVMMSDMWALENGYTVTAENVELTVDVYDEINRQYTYVVTIQAVPSGAKSINTVTAEGILTLKRDEDGRYKVHALKMLTAAPYSVISIN